MMSVEGALPVLSRVSRRAPEMLRTQQYQILIKEGEVAKKRGAGGKSVWELIDTLVPPFPTHTAR